MLIERGRVLGGRPLVRLSVTCRGSSSSFLLAKLGVCRHGEALRCHALRRHGLHREVAPRSVPKPPDIGAPGEKRYFVSGWG